MLTSLFNASNIRDLSSFKLSFILARLIFSMRGFFAYKTIKPLLMTHSCAR